MIYRHEKQSPLTSQEVDSNFEECHKRLTALEKIAFEDDGIQEITCANNELSIYTSHGKTFGPFSLPCWNGCGLWIENTPYHQHDVVQHRHSLYITHKNHLSSTTFEKDANLWKCIFTMQSHQSHITEKLPYILPHITIDQLANKSGVLGEMFLLISNEIPQTIMWNGNAWINTVTQEDILTKN